MEQLVAKKKIKKGSDMQELIEPHFLHITINKSICSHSGIKIVLKIFQTVRHDNKTTRKVKPIAHRLGSISPHSAELSII